MSDLSIHHKLQHGILEGKHFKTGRTDAHAHMYANTKHDVKSHFTSPQDEDVFLVRMCLEIMDLLSKYPNHDVFIMINLLHYL